MAYSAPAGMAEPDPDEPLVQQQAVPRRPVRGGDGGQFAPSTGANRGSVPPVAANTAWASWALRPNALAWRWQLPQLRPLLPRLRKKALPGSMCRSC